MRSAILLSLFLIYTSNSNAQQLNVDETIRYIKEQTKKYTISNGTIILKKFDITISDYGFINIKLVNYSKYYNENYNTNIVFDYSKVAVNQKDNLEIEFKSKDKNIQNQNSSYSSLDNYASIDLKLSIEGFDKVLNAFKYLLEIIKYDVRYNKKDGDPFSGRNYNSKITSDNNNLKVKDTIKLTSKGNLSNIGASICGILTEMILDSGADDVSISSKTEKELLDKGLITKDSYLTSSLYKLADGSIVKSRRMTLPFIKVGSFIVKDIQCNINPTEDIILLGKSFLNRFSKWSIDNNTHSLILER